MRDLADLLRRTGFGAIILGVALPTAAHIDGDPDRPIITGFVPNAVIVGPGERVQLALSVDCNVPQGPVTGYVTPVADRSVTLELAANSVTSDGTRIDHVESVELVSGSGPTFYEPESTPASRSSNLG